MTNQLQQYRVWDLPSRLSHWAIVILVFIQFASGLVELLPMSIHLWCGYALIVVLLFRILWGFFGSDSARFSRFLRGPSAVLRYARTLGSATPSHWPGHNPVGGWSVVLLLGLTLVQSISGLFAEKVGEITGPLVNRVARDTAHAFEELHESLYWFLMIVIVLHVTAALYYRLHKQENLIGPMFGDGRLPLRLDPAIRFAGPTRALALLALSVIAVVAVAMMGGN
jgi:cytochrome b